MLESDYQRKLNLLLSKLRSNVKLPETWEDFFDREGMVPVSPDDRRRHARRYLRQNAICELHQTLPAIERRHEFTKVYVKDFSRGGVAFLDSRQLYPGESLQLWTISGKLSCLVVRCIKHNSHCFEVGAGF
jgi:hypothetical protein